MTTYDMTTTQAAYLTDIVWAASQYRDTLHSIQDYAARELASLDSGMRNGNGGTHYQLMGELATHRQELHAKLAVAGYVLRDIEKARRQELVESAVTGAEKFFFPSDV